MLMQAKAGEDEDEEDEEGMSDDGEDEEGDAMDVDSDDGEDADAPASEGEGEDEDEEDELDAIFNMGKRDPSKDKKGTKVQAAAVPAEDEDSEDEEARRATEALFGNRGGQASGPTSDGGIDVMETGRLFLRNLPFTATDEEIRDEFSRFGEVTEVHVCLDKSTRKSKGFAYVSFEYPAHAKQALEEMDGNIFQVSRSSPPSCFFVYTERESRMMTQVLSSSIY